MNYSFSGASTRDLLFRIVELLESDREDKRESKETQQLHGSLLHTILRTLKRGGASTSTGRVPDGFAFPLASMDDFWRLEEKLGVDDEYTEALVSKGTEST